MDAKKYREEAVNHLLDEGYTYSPQKIINKINEKIKDIPMATPETEILKKKLVGRAKFYENQFRDQQGNFVDLDGVQIDKVIRDLQEAIIQKR